MNDSGILPMEYKVLVKPKRVEEKTAGGLYIPDTKREKDEFGQTEGVMVAASPLAFSFAEWPGDARKPEVGDRVFFSRYQATEVAGKDNETYWLMQDQSIAGVFEDG